ncbi:ATP-binding protein [Leucothrix arctica]|uniref:Rad50/SbcC-type AAA domain-containing protein n=1 Tax=Leucothrix arctica TaxID=1481894 RepID=A0A317CJ48_9GAMM|nr:AAA family ATPase [Leucothrix arctica]PWQ96352.1 hypothetical protein DKT75_10230 [Leucothrix arctica]
MLIQSLSAKNFRKYEQLNINDLPEKGVITVSGLNESGKSSIGEAICFALFGRTFNLTGESATKLIRWDTEATSVSLAISDSGQDYIIERSIDRNGISDAKLIKADTKVAIAEGTEATDTAIIELLGFGFNTFADSFYLTARDLSNPDPDSSSIKEMAGIGDYARISDELTTATIKNQQKIDELSPLIKDKEQELAAIDLDETWLPELVDTREIVDIESKYKQNFNGNLAELPSLYNEKQKKHKSTRRLWSFLSICTWLLFPLLLIAALAWVGFQFFPEYVSMLSEHPKVSPYMPEVQSWVSQWGFKSTMGLVIITSLVLCFKWFTEHKKEAQLTEAKVFSDTISKSHAHSQRSLESLTTSRLRQTLQGKIQAQSALLAPPQDDTPHISQLAEKCQTFTADTGDIENTVVRLRDTLDKQIQELSTLCEPLDEQIGSEKVRSDQAGAIRSRLQILQAEATDNQSQIKTQKTGVQLLQRASDALISDFNASITSRTDETMPLFTENRYKQIKIDKRLSVQVYSDEKMDWIDFDELSSGTQRQILLAVRIAMSEQLAKNTDNNHQFIFLDEPFTYFDQDRTKAALEALPHLNETTCQVWIVAQEFPEESYTDKSIPCPETGQRVLDV